MSVTELLPIVIPGLFLQLFMQIHYIQHAYQNLYFSSKKRVLWMLVILGFHLVGIAIYLFVSYKKSLKDHKDLAIHPDLQRALFLVFVILFEVFALQLLFGYEGSSRLILAVLLTAYFIGIIVLEWSYLKDHRAALYLLSLSILLIAYAIELVLPPDSIMLFALIAAITLMNALSMTAIKKSVIPLFISYLVLLVLKVSWVTPLASWDEIIPFVYLNFILFMLAIMAFYGFKQQMVNNQTLHAFNDQLEIQNQTIEAMSILAERQRLAASIHDHIGHTLTTAIISIDVGQKRMSDDLDAAKHHFDLAKTHVKKSLNDIRHLVKEESTTEALPFTSKVESLIDDIQKASQLTIHLHMAIDSPIIKLFERVLLQSLKEALTNCLKHGKADTIDVLIQSNTTHLTLSVSDNGVGCLDVNYGYGLSNMHDTISHFGGSFTTESQPGEGFTLTLRLPNGGTTHEH